MSQVSYGTITITDTNDIESIVIEYNKNQSNQNPPSEGDSNWSTNRPTWQQGYYIWQRARIHKSGTATTADIIGTPVCVTGSTGEQGQPGTAGRSLTGVETKYCIYGTGTPSDSYSGWQDTIPEYNSSTPNYWVKVTNTYSSAPTTEIVKYKDTGITNAMAKAADAQSKAATAETNASNALSLSQATRQHFWFNAEDIGSGANVIKSGAYITDTPIDDFKENKTGGYLLARSDGLVLGKDSNKDAILNSDGLITKSGGIIAGESGSNGYVYLSTHDYPLKDTSDPSNPINGLTINNHTPTAEGTDDKVIDDPAWREVIGTKFGVDSEGNLYAAGAHIDGDIIAQSLTIGSGANAYDGMAAINISGYSIEIVIENIEEDSDHVYLYPHLYHNGIEEQVSNYTRFLWYENNNEIAIIGDGTNYGRILASRSNSYRVTYEFDDGEVGSGTPIETIKVEPTEYITNIDNIGIKVHPKQWSTNSNYLQIDGNGVYIKDSNDISLAEFTASNAQIGKSGTTRFMINTDSLQAFNELGNKYFEVSEEGLIWGSNTAATTTQVNNAALTASNYITDISNSGIRIHSIEGTSSIVLDTDGMEIFKGEIDDSNSIAFYGDTARIGKIDGNHLIITSNGIDLNNGFQKLATFGTDAVIIGNNSFIGQDSTIDGISYTTIDKYGVQILYWDGVYNTRMKYTPFAVFNMASGEISEPINKGPYEVWNKTLTYTPRDDTQIKVVISYGVSREGTAIFVAGTAGTDESSGLIYDGQQTITYNDPLDPNSVISNVYYLSVNYITNVNAGGYIQIGSRSPAFVKQSNTATFGTMLAAEEQDQVAIGRYNLIKDSNNNSLNYAFMIGNGTDIDARSNALAIDWRGRIHNNNSNTTSWISGRDEAKIQFHPTISGVSEMHPYISMKTNVGAWQISTYQNNALYFAYTTDANYSSGTNSATGAYITIAGAYTNMSDRKIKKNISSINNAKEFIMQLKPVQFNFKDIENDKLHMGFIAQEVAEAGSVINDDLAVYTANYKNSSAHKEELITVETDDEELSWSLCYSELIAPLVQTVQEQQKEIDQLKNMIKNGGNNGEKSS